MRYSRTLPERGQIHVNLRDEVARDAHGRTELRDVRAGGYGHRCSVWRVRETNGSNGGMRRKDAPLTP